MKKIFFSLSITCYFITSNINAQKITFTASSKNIWNLQKIDTLFFTEYKGQKTMMSTVTVGGDTAFSQSILPFDSSFGLVTKNLAQVGIDSLKLLGFHKLFTTPFYATTNGSLCAPSSTLFMKPKNGTSRLTHLGSLVVDLDVTGFYYLYLNTNIYNTGDKIFALCDSLYNAGLVSVIEPIYALQIKQNNDPLLPNEWNVNNTGQYNGTQGADMKVANAWSLGHTGAGIKVAVIDIGVDTKHPDLQGNLLTGYDATGNGSGGAPAYDGNNTHGTGCAGIIAEVQNTIGGVGVAYNAKIIPIRYGIENSQGGVTTTSQLIYNCFKYAADNGADIISNSWGFTGQAPASTVAMIDAGIQYAVTNGRCGTGSIVLFAAGNNNSAVGYPASNPNVIAVGASSECDTRKRSSNNADDLNYGVSTDPLSTSCDGEYWWGSNYGTSLSLLAPGVHITTTTIPSSGDYTNAYINNFNGTSSACPNTAAVLALILSANPSLTSLQARKILESTCDKIGGYTYSANVSGEPNGTWCNQAGYGRVNAEAAVLAAQSSINGPTTLCSSSTYSLNRLPSGASITWSPTQSSILNIVSPNSSQTVINKEGNGVVTLTATITYTNKCGTTYTYPISKTITVGLPTIAGDYTNTYNDISYDLGYFPGITNPVCAGYYSLTNMNITGATDVKWSKVSLSSGVMGYTQLGNDLNFILYAAGQSAVFKLEASNSCGNTINEFKWQAGSCSGGGVCNQYVLSPNPTPHTLTISIPPSPAPCAVGEASIPTDSLLINQINLYDNKGTLKKTATTGGTTQTSISVDGLSTGNYILEIKSSKNYTERQIFIKQ